MLLAAMSKRTLGGTQGRSLLRCRSVNVVSQLAVSNKRQRNHNGTTQSYHTSLDLEKEQRTRLTTLRLYRLLQRQIKAFDCKAPGNDSVLLQPLLEAPDWGRHAIFHKPSSTQMEELYRLFYVWNDTDGEERGLGVYNGITDDDDAAATPSTTTTTGTTHASYDSSSIDNWYYELVTKPTNSSNDETPPGDEMVDEGSSSSLPPMTSMTCWTSQQQLRDAVRTAFRSLNYDGNPTISLLTATDLHKWAIRAIQIFQEQQTLWNHSSVATTDGVVRIVATSRCIGTSMPASTTMPPSAPTPQMLADSAPKYRFAYRIRVENVSDDQTIQLMGRYWHISEEPVAMTTSSILDNEEEVEPPPPIVVDSPATGAVGQLPVLHPGQVFEYMSGTDLATPKGTMKGHLYMARVPSTARSAQSGDNVEALLKQKQQERDNEDMSAEDFVTDFFEATVAPFSLEAS